MTEVLRTNTVRFRGCLCPAVHALILQDVANHLRGTESPGVTSRLLVARLVQEYVWLWLQPATVQSAQGDEAASQAATCAAVTVLPGTDELAGPQS